MQPPTFDSLIPVVMNDEVTQAATELAQSLMARFDPMVAEANSLSVEVDSDPIAHGLQNFHAKISVIRQHSNRVGSFLSQALAERTKARQRRDSARAAYDEKFARTLNNHPEVVDVQGMEARKNKAREILSREASIVTFSDQIFTLVSGYHDALKLKADSLKDTKSDLMSQLAVVKQQIANNEVDPARFPVERTGYGPAQSKLQDVETEVAAAIGDSGETSF